MPLGMRRKVGIEMQLCSYTIHKVENSLVNDESSPSGSYGHYFFFFLFLDVCPPSIAPIILVR